MNNKRGLFIVFEGIDGVGKSTQYARLPAFFLQKNKYHNVLLTREPTENGTELSKMLTSSGDPFSDGERMADLFIEDRKNHSNSQIVPALNQGTIVLCDRYTLSTLAYQSAQGVSLDSLVRRHLSAGIHSPDATLYFRTLASVADKRIEGRVAKGEEREKFEKLDFAEKLTRNYDLITKMATSDDILKTLLGPIYTIDATKSLDDVSNRVEEVVSLVYESWKSR